RRYGMPKALVELDGRLLVERGVATLRDGGCDPVIVVLGAAAQTVRDKAGLGDAILVDNPDWADGMGSSLRAGLAAAGTTSADAAALRGARPRARGARAGAGHGGEAGLTTAGERGVRRSRPPDRRGQGGGGRTGCAPGRAQGGRPPGVPRECCGRLDGTKAPY